mmetsp:Transcript_7813/g.18059  ORF Transcript_7813/g.18059 Transcript_7813/m.18059 type:complete len:202 (-) Transcript_7813:2219-2824(-)
MTLDHVSASKDLAPTSRRHWKVVTVAGTATSCRRSPIIDAMPFSKSNQSSASPEDAARSSATCLRVLSAKRLVFVNRQWPKARRALTLLAKFLRSRWHLKRTAMSMMVKAESNTSLLDFGSEAACCRIWKTWPQPAPMARRWCSTMKSMLDTTSPLTSGLAPLDFINLSKGSSRTCPKVSCCRTSSRSKNRIASCFKQSTA